MHILWLNNGNFILKKYSGADVRTCNADCEPVIFF